MADITKIYLDTPPDQAQQAIEEIEKALGIPGWIENRINLLSVFGESAATRVWAVPIPDPLANGGMRVMCLLKGFVEAVNQCDVTAEDVFRLVHSQEGLENFLACAKAATTGQLFEGLWGMGGKL